MKEKTKNIIIILLSLVVILLIILNVLALTGNLSLDKKEEDTNTNQNNNITENENNTEDTENSKYAEWMNYILESNIQNITLERNIVAIDTNEEDYNKKVNITTEDLKQIFSKMNNSSLIKKYSLGLGGDGDTLTISYIKNNNNYELVIRNEYIFVEDTKDNNLITLFENSNYTIENEEIKDQEGSFYVFKCNIDNTIFDSYFE